MTNEYSSEEFLNIFQQNIGIVIKISRAYTSNPQDKEDLINDIALELWKSFKKFNGNAKISTWIYRVALNTSMNYKRKKKKDSMFSPLNDFKKVDNFPWLQEQDNTSSLDIIYQCVDELNEMDKTIILLYFDGNSHDEISEITGISKTNVGTRIGRIKEQIRNLTITKI